MVDIIGYAAFGGHEMHGAWPEVIKQFMVKGEVRIKVRIMKVL